MSETATDRVAAAVRERIADGTYAPGRRLPGQRVLAEEFGTNHQSVANAIKRVRHDGLIYSVPSGGWYVRPERMVMRSTRNRLARSERDAGRGTFSTDCHAAGLTPDVDTQVDHRPAPDEVAGELGLDPGTVVLARERVMRADGEVLQLATSYLPRSITDGTAIESENPGTGGIYRRLEELGHTLTEFVERVAIGRATEHEAKLMHTSIGDPVYRVTRVAYSGTTAVEINLITITGDRYELVYELPAE